MPRTTDAREKMVTSAALLIRRDGVAATGFRDVVAHSGAPRGSIGHHFPGGKDELVRDAVLWAGATATRAIERAAQEGTTADALRTIVAIYRRSLTDTDFTAGCPIGMVAQEGHTNPMLRAATKQVFDDWRAVLRRSLRRDGFSAARARRLADGAIAGIEGALMMARIDRSTAPLDHTEQTLLAALA